MTLSSRSRDRGEGDLDAFFADLLRDAPRPCAKSRAV